VTQRRPSPRGQQRERNRRHSRQAGHGRAGTGRDRRPQQRPPQARPRRRPRKLKLAGPRFRLRSSLILLMIVLTLFAGRLVQIQGIEAYAYTEKADRLDGATEVTLTAPRGDIVDRDGTVMAETVAAHRLVTDPTMVNDAPAVAAVLSRRLDLSYFDLLSALRAPESRYEFLARRVLPAQVKKVMGELDRRDLTGVYVEDDPLRTYPAGDVASNMLGFVGTDGKGLAGLEFALDDTLTGRDGHATYMTDATGTRIPLAESTVDQPEPGRDVRLTIDRDLQWYAQRRLAQAVKQTGSESGSVITMDTRTGELLALADYPTFDPNRPVDDDNTHLGSPAVQNVYEPGSVEKALTAAALVDAGLVSPRTKITVPPLLHREAESIKDWFPHPTLRLTMAGVIAQSSNIGTVLAAEEMSSERLRAYLAKFGLGQRTGIALKGESAGLLPATESWLPITHDTIAFGQGLSVTALQMASALATIANDGVRIEPTLVRGFVDAEGQMHPDAAPDRRRVVSAHAARQVTSMMELVTAEDGTAPDAAIPGYRVAGKTGTADRVDPETGGYNGFTISFGGFAPADEPRFLTYVVLHDPSSGDGGGSAGGPVFHDITSYALQKYAVPPTGSRAPKLPTTW
jgi:cell division protein FtsI (penicillin-binding protein 3)